MAGPRKQFEDGPSQVYPAPDRLVGRVVDWQDGGAIHGYGVVDDLAAHYAPHEVLLLALLGSPPSTEQGRAFGVALTWISATHVGTAPTHTAVLARISGSPTSNLVGIAALVTAQEADYVIAQHKQLLDWLDNSAAAFDGWSERDDRWRQRLASAGGMDVAELEVARDHASAALIVFHALGLRHRAMVTAWAWSRMIGTLAESLSEPHLNMRTYPLRLPNFDYVEDP